MRDHEVTVRCEMPPCPEVVTDVTQSAIDGVPFVLLLLWAVVASAVAMYLIHKHEPE